MSDQERHYNLTNLINMVGDSPDAIANFINMFRNTSGQTLEALNSNLAEEDYPAVGKMAHKLKSSIDLMGIEEIKQTIRTVEQNGKNEENLELLPGMIKKVNRVMKLVFEELDEDYPQ